MHVSGYTIRKPSGLNAGFPVVLTALCLILLGPASRAHGQETVRLTAIGGYAPAALWVRVFLDYDIPEVDRRLAETGNYRVDWTEAFSGRGGHDRNCHELVFPEWKLGG